MIARKHARGRGRAGSQGGCGGSQRIPRSLRAARPDGHRSSPPSGRRSRCSRRDLSGRFPCHLAFSGDLSARSWSPAGMDLRDRAQCRDRLVSNGRSPRPARARSRRGVDGAGVRFSRRSGDRERRCPKSPRTRPRASPRTTRMLASDVLGRVLAIGDRENYRSARGNGEVAPSIGAPKVKRPGRPGLRPRFHRVE